MGCWSSTTVDRRYGTARQPRWHRLEREVLDNQFGLEKSSADLFQEPQTNSWEIENKALEITTMRHAHQCLVDRLGGRVLWEVLSDEGYLAEELSGPNVARMRRRPSADSRTICTRPFLSRKSAALSSPGR